MAAAAAAVTALAAKQLDNALKIVQPLQGSTYHKFKTQLFRVASTCEWDDWILDPSIREPEDNVKTLKAKVDQRNAYTLIVTRCDDHPVEDKLTLVKANDVQNAWATVIRHFVSDTNAGRQRVVTAFMTATMATTNTTISQWVRRVNDLANDMVLSGNTCEEHDKITRFMCGLLPEFDSIKNIVNHRPGPQTFSAVCEDVLDWAQNNNKEDLCKGSARQTRAFNVQDHSDRRAHRTPEEEKARIAALKNEPCRAYAAGKCRWGIKCYRNHEGPGGFTPNAPGTPAPGKYPTKAPPVSQCNFCGSPAHHMIKCEAYLATVATAPKAEQDSKTFYAQGSASGQAHGPAVHPAYSFSVHAADALPAGLGRVEDAPDCDRSSLGQYFRVFVSLALVIFAFFLLSISAALRFKVLAVACIILAGVVPAGVNTVPSVQPHGLPRHFSRRWAGVLLTLILALLVPAGSAQISPEFSLLFATASIRPSVYLNTDGVARPDSGHEW